MVEEQATDMSDDDENGAENGVAEVALPADTAPPPTLGEDDTSWQALVAAAIFLILSLRRGKTD